MSALGIDPGLTGAVALLSADSLGSVILRDVPTLATGKGARRSYDVVSMVALIDSLSPSAAFLEDPGPIAPGKIALYSLGRSVGLWQGILAARAIPYTLVRPADWSRAMGIPAKSGKEANVARALQLFPTADYGTNKKQREGRSDALLLAEYGRRQG